MLGVTQTETQYCFHILVRFWENIKSWNRSKQLKQKKKVACTWEIAKNNGRHNVISPQDFRRKSEFSEGFCLGESFFKVPREKEFWRGIWIFWFLPRRGSLILDNFTAFLGISDIENQNFLELCWNNAQILILPMLSHPSLMFSNLSKINEKGGLWGVTFQNSSGEFLLWDYISWSAEFI